MADRYFVDSAIREDGTIREDRAVLGGPEAHHLIHVMRARPGSRVVLFDGSGAEFAARVESVGRTKVELAITGREEVDRELPLNVTLGVALPKGDRQKWLVEKAVELGVRRLVPLVTARSVAQPVDQALARLRRTVIEASKQCGRNKLMEISPPQAFTDYVSETAPAHATRLLAHPRQERKRGHSTFPSVAGRFTAAGAGEEVECPLSLAVGPEGGFGGEEVALAVAAGWQAVDLGPRILRVETAAMLLVAMVAQS